MKALFSYDPKEDTIIPCQNAGLSFTRGDILHIVSQEDPMWWQARPEKDLEGMTGIIPSQLLQERRVQLVHAAYLYIKSKVSKLYTFIFVFSAFSFDRREMLQELTTKKEVKSRRARRYIESLLSLMCVLLQHNANSIQRSLVTFDFRIGQSL